MNMGKEAYSAIICSIDVNRAIGKENTLLAYLPGDLKYFRDMTIGKIVVMGRKTYESLPHGALSDRKNIVITSDTSLEKYPECETYSSVDQVFQLYQQEELFFIGGAMLYQAVMDRVDRLYITEIDHEFQLCDAYFPEIELSKWELVSKTQFAQDKDSPYSYRFLEYRRRKL